MASFYIGTASFGEKHLSHHGVKGMKWGIRRYQNPDGTLTAEGKRRYQELDDKYYSELKGKKWTEKRQAAADERLTRDLGGPEKADEIFQKMFPALVAEYGAGYTDEVDDFDQYKGKGKDALYRLADQTNKANKYAYDLWEKKYQDVLKSEKENANAGKTFIKELLNGASEEELKDKAWHKSKDKEVDAALKKAVNLEKKYYNMSHQLAEKYKDQRVREILADIPDESKDLVWYYIHNYAWYYD